jgi:glycosyltransferase involved in cell wall biosynthesis
LAGRYHPELAGARVKGFNVSALLSSRGGNSYDRFLSIGRDFGNRVRAALEIRKEVDWSKTVFFGYDTGFLEPGQWVRERGGTTIVCQMDPSRFEVDLVREEEKRWPGWAKHPLEIPEAYFQRREQEWAAADIVMVNSEWTKSALIQQGVPESKIATVPLVFEEKSLVEGRESRVEGNEEEESRADGLSREERTAKSEDRSQRTSVASGPSPNLDAPPLPSTLDARHSTPPIPLRVLFLGQVNLRKGVQYLIEAAGLVDPKKVVFDIVGSIQVADDKLAAVPTNVRFHGPVSRADAISHYRNADVFVLPTISDGFAITQLEAMSHGLPVITTPNCGEVITGGSDGFLVPARDPSALAGAFLTLADDRDRLRAMSAAALTKSRQFTGDRLAAALLALVQH